MEKLKSRFKNKLNGDQGYQLLHLMSRNVIISFFIQLCFGRNLTKLAVINNTDKAKEGRHSYTSIYTDFFAKLKYKKLNLLEIGVGGYKRSDRGGCSLRMWKHYFLRGRIYGLDIYDKSPQEERRIKIFKGSQVDVHFLETSISTIKSGLDIIIDDGSHFNEHVIFTFQYLFPKLNRGGIYVVEDTQTSYDKEYGGDPDDLTNNQTMMNWFKKIPDYINHKEIHKQLITNYKYLTEVESIHFYHNLIFIKKIE